MRLFATAGRKFPDADLDTRKADISALLSRDQPVFAISESAIFVLFRVCCLLCVPSKCAFSTLQALAQSPSIPDLRRKNKAEFAASQFSSTKSLFQFFSGCCFALPASRDSDLVQPMQSRTSSTKKGRSISAATPPMASSCTVCSALLRALLRARQDASLRPLVIGWQISEEL